MNYFNYQAAKVGMPAKPAPINGSRNTKSEFSANRQLVGSKRK